MFLSFVQRQLLGNDCHQHGSAGYTLRPTHTHIHSCWHGYWYIYHLPQQILKNRAGLIQNTAVTSTRQNVREADVHFYRLILSLTLSAASAVALASHHSSLGKALIQKTECWSSYLIWFHPINQIYIYTESSMVKHRPLWHCYNSAGFLWE